MDRARARWRWRFCDCLELKGGKASGTIFFQGRDLLKLKEREMRGCAEMNRTGAAKSAVIAESGLRIGTQLTEAWRAHASGPREEAKRRVQDALIAVSLPSDDEFLRRFPSQLSVGQAQRVLIAMAVMHRPALLMADEPTSALDVITQAEVLQLFSQTEPGSRYGRFLYISHDLPSVAGICQRIAILNEGQIVECGPTNQIFAAPSHPYTRRLMASLPRVPAVPSSQFSSFSARARGRSFQLLTLSS